jgi:hypothetical protein
MLGGHLSIKDTGRRYWRLKYRLHGNPTDAQRAAKTAARAPQI